MTYTGFSSEWRWRDSNSWPPACKAGALPTELHPHIGCYILFSSGLSNKPMGLSGLEPPTSRLSGVRSNQLSYKPIFFCNLAATYSPTPSPVQYHRPLRSLPSCSGWERVCPLSASLPEISLFSCLDNSTVKHILFLYFFRFSWIDSAVWTAYCIQFP